MNKRLILKVIGFILLVEGALLLIPMCVAFIYGEADWTYFLVTGAASAAVGAILFTIKCKKKTMYALEGYLVVALAWLVLSAVAAVPFVVSGYIPNYLDAIFETVSGFTTTGVTIMPDVEILSHSMQFWRIFTHWIGGMGILVFILAISPVAGGGSAIHMLRAESPGPTTEKISPKISTTAKYLYLIYIALTALEIAALVISGVSLYHAALIAFGTMGTGGFSYANASMAMLTFAQRNIITVFMILAGVNFSMYFLLITGKLKAVLKNEELRWYLIIYAGLCVLMTVSVSISHVFGGLGESIHYVTFQVASLITTTGYSACNMDIWPWFAKNLALLFMFIGASAGSTAGGLKVSRIIIGLKSLRDGLHGIIHPRSVSKVRYNGREAGTDIIKSVRFYIVLFVALFSASLLVICIDPKADFTTAFSAVDTTISNNGIAFGAANGPFAGFAWYSKVVFIIDMLIGRLEIFPILVLLNTIVSPVKNTGRKLARKFRHVNY